MKDMMRGFSSGVHEISTSFSAQVGQLQKLENLLAARGGSESTRDSSGDVVWRRSSHHPPHPEATDLHHHHREDPRYPSPPPLPQAQATASSLADWGAKTAPT